jgi:type VI protein secretion system component VasK
MNMADDDNASSDAEAGKHSQARQLAEKALRAEAAGNQDEADTLFAEANRIDPSAVEAALSDAGYRAAVEPAGNDEEVARMSREIRPGSAAPSRAGITNSGSGADGE